MGVFDDLIPGEGVGAGSAFDDLIPAQKAGRSTTDVIKDVGLSLWEAVPSSKDSRKRDERDDARANAVAREMYESQLQPRELPPEAQFDPDTGRYTLPGRAQDFVRDVAGAVVDLPANTRASIAALRASEPGEVIDSPALKADRERAVAPRDFVLRYGLGLDSSDIESAGKSLPFSLISAGAYLPGLVAGAASAPVTGPAAPFIAHGAGMAGSGAAAYRMDRGQVWNQLYGAANERFKKSAGRDMTADEFTEFAGQPEIAAEVTKHATAEAGFEALGNFVFSKTFGKLLGGSIIRATASDAAKAIAEKGAAAWVKAGAANLAGELATETPTQIAQGQAETALGLRAGPAPQWSSMRDWREAFAEVAWPTVLTVGAVGGAAKAVSVPLDAYGNKRLSDKINDFVEKGGHALADNDQLAGLYERAKALAETRQEDAGLTEAVKRLQDEKLARIRAGTFETKSPDATGSGQDQSGGLDTAGTAGGAAPSAETSEAEKALLTPAKAITALDRVAEIDQQLTTTELPDEDGQVLRTERDAITARWPQAVPGLATTFSTETGVRLDGRYALMESDDLVTSHDTNLRPVAAYPAELQPRERERHASEMQVQQITQRLEPARLGESADVATGAPIVGADGLVESGNARSIALKRVYQANGQKAEDYRQFLRDNATRFGVTAEEIDGLKKPVLVRVRETPVNRAEFARQANQSTVARMSPSEQAKADAAMMDSMDDLQPDEQGDFMSGNSRPFVRRFLAKLPATEQSGMIDAQGNLSQTGYSRIRNAVLAKAYGDSPVLLRMVESLDDNTRNLTKALMQVAPQVAKTRQAIDEGALFDSDITPDLMAAVEELSDLRDKGVSVKEALAQAGMFGDKLAPEARELLSVLDENIRRPRQIAGFIQRYMEGLAAAGNPNQGTLLGEATAPAKGDLLAAAKRGEDGAINEDTGGRQPGENQGADGADQRQPENAAGNQRGAQGNEADARAAAAEDFRDALNDLGAITRDFAGVARMVPESHPGLMDALVRLFDAAIRLGYHDAKKAVAYVKEQLRADARFKTVWNKILPETYRKAAMRAAEQRQGGETDLFGAPPQQNQEKRNPQPVAESQAPARSEPGEDGVATARVVVAPDIPAGWQLAENGKEYIDEHGFVRALNLSDRERTAEQALYDQILEDRNALLEKYLTEVLKPSDGLLVDPDLVKKLSSDFLVDPKLAAAVHEPSSDMAKWIFERLVQENIETPVIFTAGGSGSGKTEAMPHALKAAGLEGHNGVVFDSTLSAFDSARKKIDRVVNAGGKVVIVYTNSPLEKAFRFAMGRPRVVPLTVLAHAHNGASDTARRLAEHYKDQPRVQLIVINNLGKIEEMHVGRIADLPQYDYNESVKRLYEIATEARNDGKITEEKFQALVAGIDRNVLEGGSRALGGIQESESQGESQGLSGQPERTQGHHGSDGVNEEGGLSEPDRGDGQAGATGQGPRPARATQRKRGAQPLRQGADGGDLFADNLSGAPDGGPVRVQQDGRPAGEGQDHERRPAASAGSRTGRATGVPAGRDIPAKSGRNYRFTADDLTYEGGWQKKAAQNVEAVELIKRIQTEGRQATREEQAVLAKFIGWGASEIRNAIFGNKYAMDAAKAEQYEDAIKALKEAGGDSLKRGDDDYMLAHSLVQGDLYQTGYRYGDPITRAMLDKVRPDGAARKWVDLRNRLKAVMTDEEWATAERSTQYAHYTSRAVVESMWKAMDRMGFKGGAVIEPGAGIGVFPGLMSPAMATNSVYTGIEFDNLTGAILGQLFPDERILVESFVDSALPDNFYDVAIGNPPFANIPILSDPKYKKYAFSLHDYFFAKSIDKVKPGGLMVYVTSHHTMDKKSDKARTYLADRADLVGAIRLPQTAFMKNAGTEVVTDVLFLRKKVDGEAFAGQPWLGLAEVKTDKGKALINEYFAAHPEMVLGTHSLTGSMYAKDEYTVLPVKGADIEAQFAAAVENLPTDIYRATGAAAQAAQVREIDFNPKAQKEGNYYLSDAGVLMQREGGVGVRADAGKGEKVVAILKDFVRLRDALKQAHYDQLNDGPWETSLKALQKEYGAFVKKHGRLLQNKPFERKVTREDDETGQVIEDVVVTRRFDLLNKLNDDPDYTLVEALEKLNEETGEITESQFLRERVLARPAQPRIETPHDAMLSVLNDTGKVDMPLIAERLGLDEKETAVALGSAVYESPAGGWLMADEYLSGNVKQKLKEAQEAANTDRRYERNVEALLSAQPAPVPPSDITAAIGMNWIPENVYAQFLQEKTGVRANISYNERTGQWVVTAIAGYQTPAATSDWGTLDRNAADIIDHALTGRPIRITRTEGSGETRKTVFDAAATEAANQKLGQMRAAFADWLWQDGQRADELTRLYNDKFNTIVPRKFDGRHLTLPGSTTTIKVFDHVKRGAWRVIQAGNTYLAHSVGSGKTWQMVISAMEQKRLGLINKPMVVVPNHMLQQFAREWLQLYPAARLMVADEKQFHTDNRRRFVSRVAMSDVDGVIITHSAFKLLDLDPEFKQAMIQEQLDYLRAALEEVGGEDGKKSRDPKVRDIQNRIEKMEQKLEAAMSGTGKDKNVRFDQLGVDMLYVDEAHEFRKLAFTTQRQVKGIDSSGSDRAFDLYMKTRWLEQKRPGRSLVMASGTPVTNTLAELYSVQRFMAPQVLEDRGLQDFDSWSAMFGQENTEIEADASGKYSPVTRFTKFVNVPELTQMFREYADVLTSDHLAEMLGDKRPKVKNGSRRLDVTPQTEDYATYKEELAARLAASRAWKPSRDEPNNPDPIIKIIGDGRLAAIDMRFVNSSLPSDPESKLNQMADQVIEVYKRTADFEYMGKDGTPEPAKGAAQMVFSDLGFGAGVTEHRGFNARAWLEKRLRDAGIPGKHIAFMSDHKKSTAKLKLFQDVNAGRVRILVGSSKNMGTGVNAQQRLVALHHLDTPWYPADLEQREGRIVRQGNKNPLVEIYAYSTKGSYDTVMWQMLASKQRFIDQALSGDSSVRSIDDLTEASQFQIATAMTAGDPRAIQLVGIKADIEKYQRLFRAHEETRSRLRHDYDLAGTTAEYAARQLPAAEKLAARVQDLSGDNFKAKADGKTFDKRKEWAEALLAVLKDYSARGKEGRAKAGELSGFTVEVVGEIVRDLGGKVKEYRSGLVMTLDDEARVVLARDPNEDAVGMAMRATNAVALLGRKPAELRQRIEDAKAKRAALVDRLDAKFQFSGELADKLKEADALEAAMVADGKAKENNTETEEEPQDGGNATRLSRGAGRAMAIRDLKAVADRLSRGFKNLPAVHVLESPSQAPKELRDYIRKQGAWHDVEGAFHEGEIYLFASGIPNEERAEHVFAQHEITHYGLRGALGKDVDMALNGLYMLNAKVRKAADKVKADLGLGSNVEAVEEVLADMPSSELVKLNGWRALVRRVRNWLQKAGAKKLAARIDAWLKAGLGDQERADLVVADIVMAAREWARNGRAGPGAALYMSGTRLATSTPQKPAPTLAARADDIIKAKAGTPRPLDAALKAVTQFARLDRLTGAVYDKARFFLDRLTPEQVKAGVVSDYGIPEAVIDQRAGMQGRMRVQLRRTGELLEKLSTLTRDESRVAYEWMNADDPQSADYFRDQLPPESIQTMAEVEKMIDQLSREAVRLGQLDAESFKRNRYAYLRRSYLKHTQELTSGETKSRQRAIAILGDQYKGRGMTEATEMAKVKAAAPEWWQRKLQAGKADKGLKGEKFIRLERREVPRDQIKTSFTKKGKMQGPFIKGGSAIADTATGTLDGMTPGQAKARLAEVAYWPADEPLPPKFAAYDQSGTWEVRDTKGDKLILWRDFTKQEREAMGEIDEARYAIAKTLHGMIHDVEVGRYLEWLATRYAKKAGEAIDGKVVTASERMRDTFAPGEWVRVPETKITGTSAAKYGILAGRYLPGPIWNDVRQILGGRFKPLGETYAAILSAWKTSKTALSPAVHMNNVMANVVMADWHDVTAGHIAKALRLLLAAHEREGRGLLGRTSNLAARAGIADREAAAEVLNRFQDSGGSIGTWATQELQKDQLEPLLKALEAEIATAGEESARVGAAAALQHLLHLRFPSAWDAFKPTRAGKALTTEARNMIALYEAEDQVFRLAAWLRAKEEGANDIAAGKAARKSFLDYHINAPWIQAMRNTAFPFVAFTYRALPMLAETAAKKPWKLMKLALLAGGLNAIGYALSGGDEDDERRWLPEEKAGRVFGLVPKLIRMPWNDIHGQPVFLDIRRFVPVGDIFDAGSTHAATPILPAMVPGGPLALLGELMINKAQFTGREITKETDTAAEKAGKVIGHMYKAFAPNLVILPGTYAFEGATNAGTGKTDAFGREQSMTQAVVSSVGIKLGSYPNDVLRLNATREAQANLMEIDRNITALKRERQRNGLTDKEFRDKVAAQIEKKKRVTEDIQKRGGR